MRNTFSGFNSDYTILFYSHGYSGNHQDNFVRPSPYILIHPTLQIRKSPLDRVNSHSSHSDFIGDKNKRCLLQGKTIKLILDFLL